MPDNSAESPMSVLQVNKSLADWIRRLGTVWIEGQISQLSRRPGAKLVFIRLRDVTSEASLSLVAGADLVSSIDPPLADGARIVALASVEFWTGRGDIHLRARQLRAVGVGELLVRLEQLRRTLGAEGLFAPERKRTPPVVPKVVGLICGRNSDAQRDVMSIATRRWPAVRFEVREVPVQGASAVPAIRDALADLESIPDVEVIVVTRGGGSVEDLLPFSDEGLLRTAAAMTTPIVSAVGHERDRPLLDDVADIRAATPTDAARRVVPDVAEESARLASARTSLRGAALAGLRREHQWIQLVRRSGALGQVPLRVERERDDVTRLLTDARRAIAVRLARGEADIASLAHRVEALSPASTLARGYAVVQTVDGAVARSPDDIPVGAHMRIRLHGGALVAQRLSSLDHDAKDTP